MDFWCYCFSCCKFSRIKTKHPQEQQTLWSILGNFPVIFTQKNSGQLFFKLTHLTCLFNNQNGHPWQNQDENIEIAYAYHQRDQKWHVTIQHHVVFSIAFQFYESSFSNLPHLFWFGGIQKVRLLWLGGEKWGILKKGTETNRGRGCGQDYLYVPSLKKKFSFHFLVFHLKIHKRRGTFFERSCNSLKRTQVEGRTCKTNSDEQGRGESKIRNF